MKTMGLRKSGSFGMSGSKHVEQPVTLNLTPMIDMLVVMIIFLVKTYSTSPQFLAPSQKIDLALTSSEVAAPDAAVLLVGREGVFVDNKLVVPFADGKPMAGQMDGAGMMPTLQKTLIEMAERTKRIAASNPKVQFTGTLVLQADKAIPFTSLKPILRTAGLAGYHDFKFAGLFPR